MDDHFEPWRKQGFICKPFAGDRGDGDRFVSEFLDAAAAKKADDDWTMDEVLLGQDGGGDAAGAPALGAAAAGGLPAGGTARERSRPRRPVVAVGPARDAGALLDVGEGEGQAVVGAAVPLIEAISTRNFVKIFASKNKSSIASDDF